MNLIQKWILGKKLVQDLEQKAAIFQPGVRYEIYNGRIVSPADNKSEYIKSGYLINDIVYAVVNRILDKVRLPYWSLYKIVDESSLKKYESLISRKDLTAKEWKQAMKYKEEAMVPISKFNLRQGKLKDLLTYPNDEEIWQDHITNNCGFKLLTGDSYQWGEPLKLGANQGIPNKIWTLPSDKMVIKTDDSFPPQPSSYELMVWNKRFVAEEILHEKYWNPEWGVMGQQLYGLSPLKAALKTITRDNSAKDSSTSKFDNGGATGIIYFDNPVFQQGEGKQQVQAVKQQWSEEYSGPANQGKTVISGYKLGYIPIGLSPVDLGIIDAEKWDAVMICNIFGVPPELLGLTAKTYNNMKEATKVLITGCALPLLISKRNYLNWQFRSDWGFAGQNVYVDFDTECFPELQADITETMNAISKVTMVTPDEEREAANMDQLNTTESQEIWVMQNGSRVPLSDFQANQIDNQLMQDALQNGTANTQANQQNGNGQVPTNGQGKTGMRDRNGKDVSIAKSL